MGGGLALVGVVGGQDHLFHHPVVHPLEQLVQAQLGGALAVEGRNAPHQHVVQAVEGQGLLHHVHVHRRLDHAQGLAVALGREAALAHFGLGEGVAAGAVAQGGEGVEQGLAQLLGALAVALEQVVGHALGRFRADPGQAFEGVDEGVEATGIVDGHGRSMRPGRGKCSAGGAVRYGQAPPAGNGK